jgi:hypothetical protein
MAERFQLREFVTSNAGTLRVDEENGCLHNVKVLGLNSANGRRYSPEAIKRAAAKYEGKHLNIDHVTKPNERRSAEKRFGWLEGLYVKPDGLYAKKLNYLKSHPMSGVVVEAARRNPTLFGLSHSAIGNGRRENGVEVIEEIEDVESVDVVADPATTSGLHESRSGDSSPFSNSNYVLQRTTTDPSSGATINYFTPKSRSRVTEAEDVEAEKHDDERRQKRSRELQAKLKDAISRSDYAAMARIAKQLAELAIGQEDEDEEADEPTKKSRAAIVTKQRESRVRLVKEKGRLLRENLSRRVRERPRPQRLAVVEDRIQRPAKIALRRELVSAFRGEN